MRRRPVGVTITLLAGISARTGLAATSGTGTSTLATTLGVSANVQTAVELALGTGSGGLGTPCTLFEGGGGDWSISLGNINALGVGTPTCGGVQAVTASNATYATNYTVIPSYSGFSSATATLTLTAPAFTHASTLALVEGATSASMTSVPTSGTTHQIAVATSATPFSERSALQFRTLIGPVPFRAQQGHRGRFRRQRPSL